LPADFGTALKSQKYFKVLTAMTEKNKTQEIITEASLQGLTVKQRVQIGNRRSVKRRRNFVLAAGLFRRCFSR